MTKLCNIVKKKKKKIVGALNCTLIKKNNAGVLLIFNISQTVIIPLAFSFEKIFVYKMWHYINKHLKG